MVLLTVASVSVVRWRAGLSSYFHITPLYIPDTSSHAAGNVFRKPTGKNTPKHWCRTSSGSLQYYIIMIISAIFFCTVFHSPIIYISLCIIFISVHLSSIYLYIYHLYICASIYIAIHLLYYNILMNGSVRDDMDKCVLASTNRRLLCYVGVYVKIHVKKAQS